ncbi:hypothetical protein LSH36_165g03012 [Paralvinella palmiformis]|uniref:medium-chain acyl-CoA ligase n=1 Tax=Paralvinella palmiformis TaxID=53620 RepID=A0AAD9JT66_9ANNE|nr:hypothetical protein LSH36_165g03012 [Paralvinella palmiformis]
MAFRLARFLSRAVTHRKRFPRNTFWSASQHRFLTGSATIFTEQLRSISNLGQHVGVDGDIAVAAAGFNNYEEGIRNFKLEVPTHYNFCHDVIDKWAAVEEEELAEGAEKGCIKHLGLWWADEVGHEYKWTYSDLSTISKRIAYILTNPCALKPGDHVIMMMPSYPQYWLVFLGCIRAGITVCPCSSSHPPDVIKRHLIQSQAKCLITDHHQIDKVEKIADACPHLKTKIFMPGSRAIHNYLGWFNYADLYRTTRGLVSECEHTKSDEPMLMFFTSGTSGSYKLAEHSHASYGLASLVNGKYWYDLTRDDITWTIADGGWAKLVWGMLGAWHQGSCIFGIQYKDPKAFVYDHFRPEKILKTLEYYPITSLTASPILWRKIVQEYMSAFTGHSLRHAFSGGEVLNPEVVEKFEAGMGCKLYDGYGQTETTILLGNFKCLPGKEGSLGKPAPGSEVKIIDDEGNEVPTGCHGHIAVKVKPNRPVGLFLGYFNDPVQTSNCFIGDYYITGDTGFCDEDGYFWFVSRKEDLIETEGHIVSPFTVENALMEHPSVAECVVVSIPDHLQLSGQVIKAFIVLSEDFKDKDGEQVLTDLHEHAVSLLQPYEVPKQMMFVTSIPATSAGKQKRSAFRNQEWENVGHTA